MQKVVLDRATKLGERTITELKALQDRSVSVAATAAGRLASVRERVPADRLPQVPAPLRRVGAALPAPGEVTEVWLSLTEKLLAAEKDSVAKARRAVRQLRGGTARSTRAQRAA
jgi:hypothetical protein